MINTNIMNNTYSRRLTYLTEIQIGDLMSEHLLHHYTEKKKSSECISCRDIMNELLKIKFDSLSHAHKTKGREKKTFLQWLFSKCADEDIEVNPTIMTYKQWSEHYHNYKTDPVNMYDTNLLYNGADLDLVTYETKMFRIQAQMKWEASLVNQSVNIMDRTESEEYICAYKIQFELEKQKSIDRQNEYYRNKSFVPKTVTPSYDTSPKMFGNARASDPAACYRADNELDKCIDKIRCKIHSYELERRHYVHISSPLTRSYFLSEMEAEELIRWVNDGRYQGEFKPHIK